MTITVTVNGERVEVSEACTLDALMQRLGERPDAQATAVNGEFVPRGQRAERRLRDGDAVSCFKPIVGG
jgi:sulfur carrier protein